uniref:Uncharacterized protein n=1 Tax=Caenorhabditis japonica TaxID=281687 RepID=A0A8R1IL21_CAEJA
MANCRLITARGSCHWRQNRVFRISVNCHLATPTCQNRRDTDAPMTNWPARKRFITLSSHLCLLFPPFSLTPSFSRVLAATDPDKL